MIITDLYFSEAADAALVGAGALPGLAHAARFGVRRPLGAGGWRAWVARHLGREDLVLAAPAQVAAAAVASTPGAYWIATPVCLSPGAASVHLEHRGLLRLNRDMQAVLCERFARAFAGSPLRLQPLPCGELLLEAPGIAPVPTREPARSAGGDIAAALPQGAAAAPLRRLAAEIEMWLHAQERLPQLSAAPNALWLWGGGGAGAALSVRAASHALAGYGCEVYLDGLWHLCGTRGVALPVDFAALDAGGDALVALAVAEELHRSMHSSFLQALTRLEERFIAPAVSALRRGALAQLTLIVNDTALTVRRGSFWRLWRRPRAALAAFT